MIGSIIGTGVFTMPAVMAGAGTSLILTLVAISIGPVLLGLMFDQLTKRIPNNEGGLYAYARTAAVGAIRLPLVQHRQHGQALHPGDALEGPHLVDGGQQILAVTGAEQPARHPSSGPNR